MGDRTRIEWTDSTFNPWWGCSRVSPGCKNCYADATALRWGHDVFHRGGPRRMMSDPYWRKPLAWNRDAQRIGIPQRVFTASMADVFEDHPQAVDARQRLWDLIEQTPWLRWQLLTKRPENITTMVPWGSAWPEHVWIGTSVEDQQRADRRIPILCSIPAAVRFVSCEPLLGPVDLKQAVRTLGSERGHGLTASYVHAGDCCKRRLHGIDWIIAGGESGRTARPMHPQWARDLRETCSWAGIPYFFKQWGEWAPSGRIAIAGSRRGRVLVGDPVDDSGHRVEMVRLGKKNAGRLLDGRCHDAVPVLSR